MNAVRDEVSLRRELYSPADARIEHLRVPPHSIEAEQAVLGGLMLSPEAWADVCDALTADDFYRRDHALIWRAISELAGADKPRDAVTMGDWIEAQGLSEQVPFAYLIELANNTPSAANIRAYADIVVEKSGLRKLIGLGTDVVNAAFQPEGRGLAELVAHASQRVGELQPTQRGGLRLAGESLRGWYEQFSARYESGQRMTGLPTPWQAFNDTTHGLQPGVLYLLAARPSMGKSIAGLNIATFTALRGQTVGLFSLEMSADECHARNIASQADVPHDFVTVPSRREDEEHGYCTRMTPVIAELRKAPLYIDDTAGLTVRQFEARARRMHAKQPLDLIVVDHVHDFRIDPKLARFEYGQIAQAGKNLAKEWRIPVVMLAQLNRRVSTATEKRPTLADLRESGELEQKGDVIVFLHREDYYDTPDCKTHLQGVVEMHFAKGRNIRAGERINLRNRFDRMRLDDWEGPLPQAPVKDIRGESRVRGFTAQKSRWTNEN